MDEDILLDDIPSKTYRVLNGHISGFIDEQDAMRQAIEKVLSTKRFMHQIYSENYGTDLDDLIGEHIDLVKAEIERIVSESLLVDDRIISVENFEFAIIDKSSIAIRFDTSTIFGNIAIESEALV